VLIIWVINPTHKKFVDEKTEIKVRRSLSFIVLLTMLPSIYLAVVLVKKEVFTSKAKEFIKHELAFAETYVTSTNIDAKNKIIEVNLLGDPISTDKIKEIQINLIRYDLPETSLIMHQAKEQHIHITALK